MRWTPTPVLSIPAVLNESSNKKEEVGTSPLIEKSVEIISKKKKEILSESSEDEKLEIPGKKIHRKRLKQKNNNEKFDKKLIKGKNDLKEKSDGESSTSSSCNDGSSSEDLSSSEEEEEEEIVQNKKRFGRKASTAALSTGALTTVAACRPNNGNTRRPMKRSGECEGQEGGKKLNIKTTTTSRRQNNKDVAKVCGGKVAANKNSSKQLNKKGILNQAINRLLELDSKFETKSDDREADDADIEDEDDEKPPNKVGHNKSKVALNFESPTKKLKKQSPNLKKQKRNLDLTKSPTSEDSPKKKSSKISSKNENPNSEISTSIRDGERRSDFEDEENASLASKLKKVKKPKSTSAKTSGGKKKSESPKKQENLKNKKLKPG